MPGMFVNHISVERENIKNKTMRKQILPESVIMPISPTLVQAVGTTYLKHVTIS